MVNVEPFGALPGPIIEWAAELNTGWMVDRKHVHTDGEGKAEEESSSDVNKLDDPGIVVTADQTPRVPKPRPRLAQRPDPAGVIDTDDKMPQVPRSPRLRHADLPATVDPKRLVVNSVQSSLAKLHGITNVNTKPSTRVKSEDRTDADKGDSEQAVEPLHLVAVHKGMDVEEPDEGSSLATSEKEEPDEGPSLVKSEKEET